MQTTLGPTAERRWRRGGVMGCGLLLGLYVLVSVAPYLYRVGGAAFARQRWTASGITSYTLNVSQHCFCGVVGDYAITVQQGRVTAAVPLSGQATPTTEELRSFDRLTVESILAEVGREAERSWLVPFTHWFDVSFDWGKGYVTRYEQQLYFVADGDYRYTARNLTPLPVTEPSPSR